jgi:hypothetical protein
MKYKVTKHYDVTIPETPLDRERFLNTILEESGFFGVNSDGTELVLEPLGVGRTTDNNIYYQDLIDLTSSEAEELFALIMIDGYTMNGVEFVRANGRPTVTIDPVTFESTVTFEWDYYYNMEEYVVESHEIRKEY